MTKLKVETNPLDLLEDYICECGAAQWIDTMGRTQNGERILECKNCGKIVYGCD